MNKKVSIGIKRIMPAALVALVLIALAVFSFMPSVRGTNAIDAAAASDKLDPDALRALDNACAYVASNDFTVKSNGEIKAKAFGIPHTQKIKGKRGVKDGVFTETAESKSAFIKAAFKKTSTADGFDVSKGEYKKKKFVYKKPKHLSSDEFIAAYGKPATGLVRYELDGSITEAKKVKDGVYQYTLDAKRASRYCKNEVKTLTGSKKHPKYESVSFTLYCDGDRPVKVRSREKFRADICGGIHCTATYNEIFDFGDKN